MENGPDHIGLLDLRGKTGTIAAVGRMMARVQVDGERGDRPIPLAILEPEPKPKRSARPGAKGVVNVYDVTCPKCEARTGEPCFNPKSLAELGHPHRERELAALDRL
jgi:hypothetical protein